ESGHVCRRECRVTRDETSEMADENSRIYVGTAARRKADDDSHDFAAVEIRYGVLIDIRAAAFRRQSGVAAPASKNRSNTTNRILNFWPVTLCGNVPQILGDNLGDQAHFRHAESHSISPPRR